MDTAERKYFSPAADRAPGPVSRARVAQIVEAAVNACRAGTLADLVREHPRAYRWFSRRLLGGGIAALGEFARSPDLPALVAVTALHWAIDEIRPDHRPAGDAIERSAWIESTSWRPMLALACHLGFAVVPDFSDRYRRRPGESAVENLCGLWSVGTSTFYRYADKGKRLISQVFVDLSFDRHRRLSLRRRFAGEAMRRLKADTASARAGWHAARAAEALLDLRPADALWHQVEAGLDERAVHSLQRYPTELAALPETDLLVEQLLARAETARRRIELVLAQAMLSRARNDDEREHASLEHALRLARDADDPLMLGVAFGALGRFHELRDSDRAFACYEESAELLRDAEPLADGSANPDAVGPYLTTLVRLAWLHVIRNDPRSKLILDRAENLRSSVNLSDEVLGLLEQTWGEYWRRAGRIDAALRHKQRALNVFERSGDQRSVLATWCNLCLIYSDSRNFERAVECANHVLTIAQRTMVEPEILTSTCINLGIAHFGLSDWSAAIAAYEQALAQAEASGLTRQRHIANLNLAEAYYKRFAEHRDPQDEALGDRHAAAAMKSSPTESSAAMIDAARKMKAEIVGRSSGMMVDRLLPQELALHFEQIAEIGRQRELLSVPASAEAQARAHLAIAAGYLAIALKERDAALALIERHGLGGAMLDEVARLRVEFQNRQGEEDRIAAAWRDAASDLIAEPRRAALISALLRDGTINKSGYAELGGVSLATASKHLVGLAERGLLQQSGKGPSTRYRLAR